MSEREWQPMETCPAGERVLMYWNDPAYPSKSGPQVIAHMGPNRMVSARGVGYTHWQPLPSPPIKPEQQE